MNLVRIADIIYSVDVGFGGLGPTKPLPLIQGAISQWGATVAEMRLTYHETKESFVQGIWTYEHKIEPSSSWQSVYHFSLTRFSAKDFDIMNHAVSTRRTSLFTKNSKSASILPAIYYSKVSLKVMCSKTIFDETTDEIVGVWTLLDRTFKKRIHDRSEVLVECKNDAERLEIFKTYFGIVLSEKDQAGIKGTVTDLG